MLDPQLRLGGRVHLTLPQGVTIRPATLADCESLAPRLREEDKAEALAASGIPALYALKLSLGPETFVIDIDGTPEMIFGCPNGVPWMFSTPVPVSPKWRRAFLRETAKMVDIWQAKFPILHNFIDARNTTHMRWLKWLGFTFIARHDRYGPLGLPFYEFVRINPNV
jgi:hypothetical protein